MGPTITPLLPIVIAWPCFSLVRRRVAILATTIPARAN